MKKIFTVLAAMILSIALYAQDEKQVREIPSFNKIDVSGNITVIIAQGEPQQVSVTTRADMHEKIITEVVNGTLKISTKGKTEGSKKVEITVSNLVRIKQSGATVVKSEGLIKTQALEIESSGASITSLNIEADVFTSNVSGVGELKLKGTATNLNATVSGAANIKAFDLVTQKADINISGAGVVRIDVIEELNVKVTGAGKVLYKNEPEKKDVEISGAGEIRKAKTEGEDAKTDTTKIRLGSKNYIIFSEDDTVACRTKKTRHNNHWAGIDLGVAGYLSPQQSFGMEHENQLFELDYSRSRTWNINFLEKNLKLYKNHVGIVTGMGLSFTRYHFNNRQTALIPYTDSTFMFETNSVTRKNLLSASYLTVPLLIEFNTHQNSQKSFHFATGLIGGYRINSKTVQITEFEGVKSRLVIKDDYNLSPFNLNATVRFGYGNFNLFATYSLTEMFDKGKGPELFPVTAGITLIGF
ncbi:MAG: DUF2807 domain-containing protein [Bacteroidetes bacterium]|nr:DUF2807 domain-containing protein [Bacteroidota bacterium]HET6244132.1 DUF2807 domain-containing protein [Bacteroidia bacterium]